MSFQNVNIHTRAGRYGKIITCPKCMNEEKVYHFSWCALQCMKCKEIIEKLDYLLKKKK